MGNSHPSLLKTRRLTRSFGGLTAVNAVDLQVGDREIVSLIGPNGAGKTTVFNLITGFLRPSAGEVLYKGEAIAGLPPHAIARRRIVRTFQNIKIFPAATVFDGVFMGCHLHVRSGVWQVLTNGAFRRSEEQALRERVAGILGFVGIEHRAGVRAQNLAYGEQRVLEIAIALAADPELLLLDEPTAGMNPEETLAVMTLIYRIRDKGITVLLVEHDMNLVMKISDRIIVLDSGTKIAEGRPRQIQENEAVIRAYLGKDSLRRA